MPSGIKAVFLYVSILINFSTCRDFYMGMFKKNDLLMSHDTLYKEKVSFGVMYAKYGRTFNCPITYVRVVDRLNIGRGPRTEVIRGGLKKKYIVLRLTSPYNNPISVNIFIGCENKKFTNPPWKIIRVTTRTSTGSDGTITTIKEPGATSPGAVEKNEAESTSNRNSGAEGNDKVKVSTEPYPEPSTEPYTKPSPEAPTEAPVEAPAKAPTEAPAEAPAEASTIASTKAPTSASTAASTAASNAAPGTN